MNPFQSFHNYEEFICTLKERHSSIKSSTVIIVQRGKRTAIVQGEITFEKAFWITVKERLSFDNNQVVIESYGDEMWHYDENNRMV